MRPHQIIGAMSPEDFWRRDLARLEEVLDADPLYRLGRG